MPKTKDISAKLNIPTAEDELFVAPGVEQMGARVGGLSMFSNVFKRGFGDQIFGNDENGLWMGKADFEGAPFRVDYDGNATATSMTIDGYILDGQAAADINANATTVNGGKITASTITATQIAANAITATQIAANAVTADKIAALAIVAGKIAANAVTANEINVSSLSAISANIGTVTAGTINGTTINAGSGGGGLNLYGDSFSIKDSGGTERGRFFASGLSLRVEVSSGVFQMSAKISFDNIAGTGFFVPGGLESERNSQARAYSGLKVDGDLEWYDAKLHPSGSRYVFKDSGGSERVSIVPDGTNSQLRMNGFNLQLTSNKTAIVPVDDEYRALYCIESPDVWFMDFVDRLDNEDPIFEKVTTGEAKVIELKGGGYQIWRKRKGHDQFRFEKKTREEFLVNESFYRMAKI